MNSGVLLLIAIGAAAYLLTQTQASPGVPTVSGGTCPGSPGCPGYAVPCPTGWTQSAEGCVNPATGLTYETDYGVNVTGPAVNCPGSPGCPGYIGPLGGLNGVWNV